MPQQAAFTYIALIVRAANAPYRSCTQCQSKNRREFGTEMMIHSGSLGATPDLFSFLTAWVCCDCGYSTFNFRKMSCSNLTKFA
jgi:hypothetical protein